MSRATPKMRDIAKRLITYEAMGHTLSAAKSATGFAVCEKLRPNLATLMGSTGFRALLSRALALAHTEVAWLRALQVKSDGSLDGLDDGAVPLNPDEWLEGRVVLIAHLLGLLVAFIGEILTLRLVREVWPKLSLDDFEFNDGDKNEKAK